MRGADRLLRGAPRPLPAGIDTLDRELAGLAADLERDIGKVYRKYERIERTLRSARDKKIAERDRASLLGGYAGGSLPDVGALMGAVTGAVSGSITGASAVAGAVTGAVTGAVFGGKK